MESVMKAGVNITKLLQSNCLFLTIYIIISPSFFETRQQREWNHRANRRDFPLSRGSLHDAFPFVAEAARQSQGDERTSLEEFVRYPSFQSQPALWTNEFWKANICQILVKYKAKPDHKHYYKHYHHLHLQSSWAWPFAVKSSITAQHNNEICFLQEFNLEITLKLRLCILTLD